MVPGAKATLSPITSFIPNQLHQQTIVKEIQPNYDDKLNSSYFQESFQTTKSSEIFRVCRAHAAAAESESEQTFASCDQQPCALPTYSELWNDREKIIMRA